VTHLLYLNSGGYTRVTEEGELRSEIIHLRLIRPSMDKHAQVGLVGDDLSRQGNLGACGRDRWHAAVHAVVVGSIHASPIPVNTAAQPCTFAMLDGDPLTCPTLTLSC
jgi:hypothetical protein